MSIKLFSLKVFFLMTYAFVLYQAVQANKPLEGKSVSDAILANELLKGKSVSPTTQDNESLDGKSACDGDLDNELLKGKSVCELKKIIALRERSFKVANDKYNAHNEKIKKIKRYESKYKETKADIEQRKDLANKKGCALSSYHRALNALDMVQGYTPGFSR